MKCSSTQQKVSDISDISVSFCLFVRPVTSDFKTVYSSLNFKTKPSFKFDLNAREIKSPLTNIHPIEAIWIFLNFISF